MSDETPRLHLAQLVSMQEMNDVTWNEALAQLDALVDLCLLGQYVNAPPANPADGDAYLIGGAPTGAWNGYAYKIASCLDGAWRFYTPFNGLRAYVAMTGAFVVYLNGTWTDWNSLITANEISVASAATCDLGAAGSLFVQITGTTTITSFGAQANKLRYVCFAQGLTLTHNAASLILLGGTSRTTAAGDVGLYASDASGNWRERSYFRAAANPGDLATKSGTETLANKTLSSPALSGTVAGTLLLGSPSAIIGAHTVKNGGTAEGGAILVFANGNNTGAAAIWDARGTAPNGAASALTFTGNSVTGRSINAGGTVNASGSDYAEYETKSETCGVVEKGAIVGFDADGKLTDKWAAARSFGVKSTAPSYVGSDEWGTPQLPGRGLPAAPLRGETESDAAFAARLIEYRQAVAAFEAALEAARQKVDRIAYAGKVPVNVTGAAVGDYIVAAQDGDGIKAVSVSAPTFGQYRSCIGRVRAVTPDGRAVVAVIVH